VGHSVDEVVQPRLDVGHRHLPSAPDDHTTSRGKDQHTCPAPSTLPRMSSPDSAPVPAPTTDLRSGPPLHEACRPLSALVGVWRGSGEVDYPTIDGPYRFGQQLTLAHDGR